MTTTRLHVRKLIARFGGQSELCRRMNAKGYQVTGKAIEKWIERDSIPGNRLIQLFELGVSEGHPIDLYGFLTQPNKQDNSHPHRHEKDQTDRAG